MKKITVLLVMVLFQICNLDAKESGFQILNPSMLGISNSEQIDEQLLLAKESKYDTAQIQTSAVCDMCKERLEHDMAFEKGVKSVELDGDTKILTIVYRKDKTDKEKLKVAITEIGYDADELPANQKAHDRLPACCQKDNEPH